MRFYDLIVSDNKGRQVKRWTTHPNGKYDAGAQNIMFDIIVAPFSTPTGGQTITIEGISLDDLRHATDFAGLNFQLSAGMKKGLPLANELQSGVIAIGNIFQSFGNWEGTEMSLTFVIYPASDVLNLVLHWPANTQLSVAISNMLAIAFPGVTVNMNIGSYTAGYDQHGANDTMDEMCQVIAGLTGGKVKIVLQNGALDVFDATYKPQAKRLLFTDLIGQPTWIAAKQMQFKTVLRADISLGSIIQMPVGSSNVPGQVIATGQSYPSGIDYKTTFSGDFSVIESRQIGNSRSAEGAQWASIFTVVPA